MKRLTVFAMTEKGYAVVASLLSTHPGIIDSVIAARDPSIAKDYYDELAALCEAHDVGFHDRTNSYAVRTEYALAVSWRWLIEPGSARLIVLHDSLLPRYRGFNPLVTALINGDTEIGVTALFAKEEYDRGDIIARAASEISYPITIQDAIEITLTGYRALAKQIADDLARGLEPTATPQDEADASYSLWRDEEDYFIDWNAAASKIRRMVDALGHPYKGAASTVEGTVARVLKAEALDDVDVANRVAGKVLFVRDSKPVVVCGTGLLRIDELVSDETGASMLPLPRFRTRFK